MRARSRQSTTTCLQPEGRVVYGPTGETVMSSPARSYFFIYRDESITDMSGPARTSKPCTHTLSRSAGHFVQYWKKWNNLPDFYYQANLFPDLVSFASPPVFETSQGQADSLAAIIKGNLNDQVLAPVFIKELPQIKSTWDELRKAEFGAKKFANKFLAYKFGILPFIGDLDALVHGHHKIAEHINYINSSYNTIIKRSAASGSCTGNSVGSFAWSGSQRTHCKLQVFRQYDAQDKINAYLDVYGASLLNVAWEVIPYSFVVDWFVNIGSVVNHLQPKFQRPCCRLISACTTRKATSSSYSRAYDEWANEYVNGPEMYHKYFDRDNSVPSSGSLLEKGLTFSRAPIAGALLLQKLL